MARRNFLYENEHGNSDLANEEQEWQLPHLDKILLNGVAVNIRL